jgi:hypothetical protein
MKIFSERQEYIYREDAKDAKDGKIEINRLVLDFLASFAPWRFKGSLSSLSGLGIYDF